MALFKRSGGKAELRALVDEFELPSFPAATLRILEIIRDDATSPADVAESLLVDPGLSVRVLRVVNSASTGLRQSVEDVSHAVHLIGRSALESLIISVAVRGALPCKVQRGFDPGRFWRTAARRAALAKQLARELCPSEAVQCFTAALLQDMALPLLIQRKGERYAELLEKWHAGEAELHELERETFGWDHAQLGRVICERWQLPEDLGCAIGGHHADTDAEAEVPSPVRLAALLGETDEEAGVQRLVECASARHGLDRDRLLELVAEALEEGESLAGLLG